jgi:ribonuclease PH
VGDEFPRAVISVVVQVIEDSGSLLSVAINATTLALMDAGVPMLSVVTSSTCALLPDGGLFLDPSRTEEEVQIQSISHLPKCTTDSAALCS